MLFKDDYERTYKESLLLTKHRPFIAQPRTYYLNMQYDHLSLLGWWLNKNYEQLSSELPRVVNNESYEELDEAIARILEQNE